MALVCALAAGACFDNANDSADGGELADAATPDALMVDASVPPDSTPPDTGADAGTDGTADTAADVAADSALDVAADTAADVAVDAASHCSNGVRDADETGIDCGGPTCLAQGKSCPIGQPCLTPNDCVTLACSSSHLCIGKSNGSSCTNGVECTTGQCLSVQGGGGSVCCATACATQAPDTCGTTGECLFNGQSCALYQNNTHCHSCSVSTLTTSTCNGAGACNAGGSPQACSGNLLCASGTSCLTACGVNGTAPNATSTGCVAGYYCDTVPTTPTCSNVKKSTLATCNNNFECQNGTCNSGKCN